jgi:hypothetical protein
MNIDYQLLAKQKATLVDVIANGLLTENQKADLQGLLHFVDFEQDSEIDRVGGKNVFFMNEENDIVDGDENFVKKSDWTPGPEWRNIVQAVVNSSSDEGCEGLVVVDEGALAILEEALND